MKRVVSSEWRVKSRRYPELVEGLRFTLHASLFTLFLFFVSALAQETSEQLQAIDQYITNSQAKLLEYQQQISSIDTELGSMAGALEEQIAQRDLINTDIAELRQQNDILRGQIAEGEAQLATTQARFEEVGGSITQLQTRVQELLVNIYEERSNPFARILANSESFHELRVKNYYLSLLSIQDEQVIKELNTAVLELNKLQAQESQQLETLNAQRKAREDSEAILASKRSEVEAIMVELDSSREGRLATQKALFQESANLEDAIGNLQQDREAEIARLRAEAEIKRQAAAEAATQVEIDQLNEEADNADAMADTLAAPPPALASGGYITPLENSTIEYPFGKLGNYLVLKASTNGAAVLAVQPGNIIEVKPISANDGSIVVIQHAGGLTTAYVNLQDNPPVQIGQQVSQGAIIGYVGGGLQLDILKFYTRIEKNGSGSYVDPAELLGM